MLCVLCGNQRLSKDREQWEMTPLANIHKALCPRAKNEHALFVKALLKRRENRRDRSLKCTHNMSVSLQCSFSLSGHTMHRAVRFLFSQNNIHEWVTGCALFMTFRHRSSETRRDLIDLARKQKHNVLRKVVLV